MNIRYRAHFSALVLLSALAAAPVHAQDAPADPGRDILVVGQKNMPITIVPRGLSVSLGDAQFAGVNAANTEDLIKYAPDFFVRTRFIGDNNAVPGFRGTHSTQSARSLVMVDGFVVSNFLGNSFSYPPAWGIVSPTEVAQFDVVYGPYSARYAGNSMGGIVNITTRAPTETSAFGTVQGFAQPYRQYATRDTYYGYAAEAGFVLKPADSPWGLRVSVRQLENTGQPQQFYQLGYAAALYGDPAAGTPITGAIADPAGVPISGTGAIVAPVAGDYSPVTARHDQARAQLRYDRGGFHAEALVAYWWNRETMLDPQTYLRDATGAPFYGDAVRVVSTGGHSWTFDPATTFRLGIADKDEWLAGVRIEAPVAGFTVRANLSTLRFANQSSRTSNGWQAGVTNGAGQLTDQGPTGWLTGDLVAARRLGAHDIAVGLNANRYETDQSVFATDDWRAATGRVLRTRTFGRTRMIGMFGEDAIQLGADTLLTLGARVDWWRAFDGGLTGRAGADYATRLYATRAQSAFSPKLSLRHAFTPDWVAELSLATATRFPTVGELFQGSLNGDGSFNQNSFDPDLKPEKSRDANLLVRHPIGPVTLTASLFYQRVRDAIFSFIGFNQNGVSTASFKNIDATRQIGVELIAEARNWPLDGLDVDANAAWIDAITAKNRADPASVGVQFPRIPRWRLNGNLRWRLLPNVQAVVGARYASRPNTDLDGLLRGDTYGYTSELFALDLKANLDVTERLRFSGGVNNLTNDRAWVFHPYPQRTFFVEAGVKL
ncbi:TonB-dependent receptor [Hephaestia sp. GCM10023244]|uniref:TonB-dependent receptor n=1 Tax=unclassified Hephaestia TaxID=2631281 RepID=UPI002076DCA7|nr:TonB-dependent receptor [Hephaestia sp. MAHUQ-44]MCM8731884.1 TonB-dependent receptor [Hephaestia sp. MAHUQ-44]